MALTPKQNHLLLFIDERLRATGMAPTFQEMAAEIGISAKAAVHRRLTELERLGWIERGFRQARAIKIKRPLVGTEAERRLHAAAPALLEACELQRRLLAEIPWAHDRFAQAATAADRAIAAALGRGHPNTPRRSA